MEVMFMAVKPSEHIGRNSWATISPHVEPKKIIQELDGSTAVEVHQVVHDLKGALLLDETVRHVFRIEGRQGEALRY